MSQGEHYSFGPVSAQPTVNFKAGLLTGPLKPDHPLPAQLTPFAGDKAISVLVHGPNANKIKHLFEEGFLSYGGGGAPRRQALRLAASDLPLRPLPLHSPHKSDERQTRS